MCEKKTEIKIFDEKILIFVLLYFIKYISSCAEICKGEQRFQAF